MKLAVQTGRSQSEQREIWCSPDVSSRAVRLPGIKRFQIEDVGLGVVNERKDEEGRLSKSSGREQKKQKPKSRLKVLL